MPIENGCQRVPAGDHLEDDLMHDTKTQQRRQRADTVFFLIVGILLFALLIYAYLLIQARQHLEMLVAGEAQKARLLTHMQGLARQRTRSLHTLLRARDATFYDAWQQLNNFDSAYLNIRQTLRSEPLSDEHQSVFAQHDILLATSTAQQARIDELLRAHNYHAAHQVLFGEVIPIQDKLIDFTERLAGIQQQTASSDIEAARGDIATLIVYMIVSVLLALAILAGIAYTTLRRLRKNQIHSAYERQCSFTAFAAISDAVLVMDEHGQIEHINKAAEKLLDVTEQDVIGKAIESLLGITSASHGPQHNLIRTVLESGAGIELGDTRCLIHQTNQELAAEINATPIVRTTDETSGVVLIIRDVSRMTALSTELERQAMQDSLTGLLNRREFENRLEQTITEVRRYPAEQAWFCYLDMDQFKIINDTCGHLAGDELLKQVAHKLVTITREVDHIGRVGSDEFSIILKRCKQDMALQIMERIRNEIHDMRFCWDNKCFAVTVSIGIVEINAQCTTVYDVLKAADTACHIAKEDGRNRIRVYDQDDQTSSRHQGEMEWVHRIYRAIETGQFVLFFQEIKSLKPEPAGIHGELLVRMIDDDGNIIPPYAFIPAAERYNLMQEVDRHIVHLALSSISRHYDNPLVYNGLFAINLSAQSLSDDTFLDFVLTQLANARIQPSNICFEITETAAISNLVRATKFIKTLKEKGCYFALDDFGSGLSSFAYLKNLPVDYIKIDGGFVKGMLNNSLDYALVSAVNQIGHVVGMSTIAEFVETIDIEDILTSMGVDFGQGYGIARPEPFETLLSKLAADARTSSAS